MLKLKLILKSLQKRHPATSDYLNKKDCIMSTPFKGGRHISVSVSVRSHPKALPARFFFGCTKI